jgi:hypothetical protein
MAESINLNGPYDTQIPGYDEDADIKRALRLFLYGTNALPATMADVQSESIAGYLKALQADIDAVDAKGIGSGVLSQYPTGVANGYIWVDSTSSVTSDVQYAIASYQTSQPSSPTTGTLWVDSDSSPLKLYVWSGSAWREIGA